MGFCAAIAELAVALAVALAAVWQRCLRTSVPGSGQGVHEKSTDSLTGSGAVRHNPHAARVDKIRSEMCYAALWSAIKRPLFYLS